MVGVAEWTMGIVTWGTGGSPRPALITLCSGWGTLLPDLSWRSAPSSGSTRASGRVSLIQMCQTGHPADPAELWRQTPGLRRDSDRAVPKPHPASGSGRSLALKRQLGQEGGILSAKLRRALHLWSSHFPSPASASSTSKRGKLHRKETVRTASGARQSPVRAEAYVGAAGAQ